MLFVGLFQMDRSREIDFWAVFWQGQGPPADFKLIAAYNLLTDQRVIVFEADTIGAIRWLDKLNMIGRFEAHPALDQTEGYRSVVERDPEAFRRFQAARGGSPPGIDHQVEMRRRAMEAPNVWAALELVDEWKRGPR